MSHCLASEAGLHFHGKAISYRGRTGRCYRLVAAGAIRSATSELSMPRVVSVAILKTECPLLQARWCWDKTRSALAHASRPRSPWTAPWPRCASGTTSAPRQAPLALQALTSSFIVKVTVMTVCDWLHGRSVPMQVHLCVRARLLLVPHSFCRDQAEGIHRHDCTRMCAALPHLAAARLSEWSQSHLMIAKLV